MVLPTVDGVTFAKRMLLTINQAATTLTDYQIKKTITYKDAMQANMDDIRFTTLDGTLIDYWVESVTASTNADIWLEVPAISNTTITKIWMYYGNTDISSGSSGANTFIQYHGAATTDYLDSLTVSPSNLIYESYLKVTSATHNNLIGLSNSATVADDGIFFQLYDVGDLRRGINENENTTTTISESPDIDIDSYVYLKITHDGSTIRYYIDENQISSGATTNFPDEDLGLYLWNASGTVIQDWSFIRKYTATEPTWGSDGIEQHQRRILQFIN